MKSPMVFALFVVMALPAAAQQAGKPAAQDSQRERAIKRCKENRGTDCQSKEGLRQWMDEERPISDADRQAAAAGRRHREECARNKKGAGC